MNDDLDPKELSSKVHELIDAASSSIEPSDRLRQKLADSRREVGNPRSVPDSEKPQSLRGRFLAVAAGLALILMGSLAWFSVAAGRIDEAQPSTAVDEIDKAVRSGFGADRVITSADQEELAGGFKVPEGQIWEFDPTNDVEIQVNENVVVEGILRMRPESSAVDHFLHFVDVNENEFVGGSGGVVESDVGLWVVGDGQLDLVGHNRAAWTNLRLEARSGDKVLTLNSAPSGWVVGDEVSIAPTVSPSQSQSHDQGFEVRSIESIAGEKITLDSALEFDHPLVNSRWSAEVINLTRNVRIEGSGDNGPSPSVDGRTHVYIRSTKAQNIRFAQLRHVGVRQNTGDQTFPTAGVKGRYGLNFDNSGDGSRGSIVQGVVVRDYGDRAYSPNASHGITIRDSIAYDGWDSGFEWDSAESTDSDQDAEVGKTDDLLYERNLVALLSSDPDFRGFSLRGFSLGSGDNLVVRDSVAVGVAGSSSAAGFAWPTQSGDFESGARQFSNNLAHNNRANGIYIRQSGGEGDFVEGLVGFNNGTSDLLVESRQSGFVFNDLQLNGDGKTALSQKAAAVLDNSSRSDGYTLSYENVKSPGRLSLGAQLGDSSRPVLFKDCEFAEVMVENEGSKFGRYDFVDCDLEFEDFVLDSISEGTVIRVQKNGSAFEIDDRAVRTEIDRFYQ